MISQSDLKALLEYNPETGVFTWRNKMRGPVNAGDVAGRQKPNGYLSIKAQQKDYYAHRLAFLYMTGDWPPEHVDHINGDRCDNRWGNLRPATVSQNLGNTGKHARNTSGFKGVSIHKKTGLWRARLGRETIGYFKTPEEAHVVYSHAAKNYFGEFART